VSEGEGLRTDCTIFVPLGGGCELRDIQITNLRPTAARGDAIPLVEYTHPDALRQPELGNSIAQHGDNVAALLHPMGMLRPGQTWRLITQHGQAGSLAEARPE